MIFAHPQMETFLEISGERACSLVVENPDFYRSLLWDLYEQLRGNSGKVVLSCNNEILPVGKWVELVDNCLTFSMNRKSLLGKLCAALEETALSEVFFLKTMELLGHVERYMDDLSFSFPVDIICEKCTVSGLVRGMGIGVRDEYADPLERLADYMELVREFERDKLFVLVGLRSLFSDQKVSAFLKTALDHGYHILLLDCTDRERLPMEKRLTIDKDLCEF